MIYVYKGGAPKDPPPASPPVSQSNADIEQAKTQQRRDAAKRRGYASSLLAGETGGADTRMTSLLG